jgi:hypothetical protein
MRERKHTNSAVEEDSGESQAPLTAFDRERGRGKVGREIIEVGKMYGRRWAGKVGREIPFYLSVEEFPKKRAPVTAFDREKGKEKWAGKRWEENIHYREHIQNMHSTGLKSMHDTGLKSMHETGLKSMHETGLKSMHEN